MAYLSAWGLHKAINTFCCSPPVLQTCWAVQKGKRGNLLASLRPFISPRARRKHARTPTSRHTAFVANINDLLGATVLHSDRVEMYLGWMKGS